MAVTNEADFGRNSSMDIGYQSNAIPENLILLEKKNEKNKSIFFLMKIFNLLALAHF